VAESEPNSDRGKRCACLGHCASPLDIVAGSHGFDHPDMAETIRLDGIKGNDGIGARGQHGTGRRYEERQFQRVVGAGTEAVIGSHREAVQRRAVVGRDRRCGADVLGENSPHRLLQPHPFRSEARRSGVDAGNRLLKRDNCPHQPPEIYHRQRSSPRPSHPARRVFFP